jgi:tetratricopeptide (TPR) repeat protein
MAIKTIKLDGFAQLIALLVAALICVAAVYLVVKWCWGDALATQTQSKELAEYAVALDTRNPRTHYALAVLRERTFLTEDFQKSLEGYEQAASIAPNDFRMWFDLAKARDRNGDSNGAEKAFRKAVELAPYYSRTHWALGNLLLREGRTDEAFAEIRRAADNDPGFSAPAVTVAWNFFEGNVPQISQKIGDSVSIKAALSTFLAKQNRFEEAFLLWNALSAEDKRNAYKDNSEALLQSLIGAKKFRDAVSVQAQLSETEGEKIEIGKIYNGSFEADVKAANANFFDWIIADGFQPQIGFDNAQKRSGNRSLVNLYNSVNGQDFRAIRQTIAVEAGKRYRFETFARSELKTTATFKWEIADAAVTDGKILGSTDAAPANSDWTALTAEFNTSPTTEAVIVRLARVPCQNSLCPITGKIWFDDFSLKKIE